MRYRLRTLMVLLALGPPVLAGMWFAPTWLRLLADVDVSKGILGTLIAVAVLIGVVILWLAVLLAIVLLAMRGHDLAARFAQRK